MRQFHQLVFDNVLSEAYSASVIPLFSGSEYDSLLGSTDSLCLVAVVDQVVGSYMGFTVHVEQSPDRVHWVAVSATPEINNVSLNAAQTNIFVASQAPSAGFVRLRVYFNGGLTPGARVRVYATGRGD